MTAGIGPIPRVYGYRSWGRKRRLRWIWVLLALCLVSYFLVSGDFGLYRMAHQAREKKAVQLEIEALRQRNAQLEEQIVLLRTDINYIEKLARERYGMVREGEKLFRIKPEPSK